MPLPPSPPPLMKAPVSHLLVPRQHPGQIHGTDPKLVSPPAPAARRERFHRQHHAALGVFRVSLEGQTGPEFGRVDVRYGVALLAGQVRRRVENVPVQTPLRIGGETGGIEGDVPESAGGGTGVERGVGGVGEAGTDEVHRGVRCVGGGEGPEAHPFEVGHGGELGPVGGLDGKRKSGGGDGGGH